MAEVTQGAPALAGDAHVPAVRPLNDRAPRRYHGRLARPLVWPLLIVVGFGLLQFFAGTSWTFYPDSYRYARAAEQFLGASHERAHQMALNAFCTSKANQAVDAQRLSPVAGDLATVRRSTKRACVHRWETASDITTSDPRYQSIFSTRPGYPLLAAPFVKAFGILPGMRVLGVLIAIGASLLLVGLLRSGGLSMAAAVLGQAIFLASPLGLWSLQPLSEGLVTVCVVAFMWGGALLWRRRMWPGTLLCLASLGAGSVTRYSSLLILTAAIGGVLILALCLSPRVRHAGTVVLASISVAGAALILTGMQVFTLPSSQVTLQDTFTRHFSGPPVTDAWGKTFALAGRLWAHWFATQAAMPIFLVLAVLAAWALITRRSMLALLALPVAVVGVAQVTVHPLVGESDRLGVLMWMPIVVGLPVLFDSIRRGRDIDGSRADAVADRVDTADLRLW